MFLQKPSSASAFYYQMLSLGCQELLLNRVTIKTMANRKYTLNARLSVMGRGAEAKHGTPMIRGNLFLHNIMAQNCFLPGVQL